MKTTHKCEKCGKEFKEEDFFECLDHEMRHIKPENIVELEGYGINPIQLGYPNRLIVEMSDGNKAIYVLWGLRTNSFQLEEQEKEAASSDPIPFTED